MDRLIDLIKLVKPGPLAMESRFLKVSSVTSLLLLVLVIIVDLCSKDIFLIR